MAVQEDLYNQWKKDYEAPFSGWDFSYLKDRRIDEQPPWNYIELAKELSRKSKAVLDMGTGGGEKFASLAPFPEHAVATEGYKPNVAVARQKLEPLGVKVVEVDESYNLPFENEEFDLVLNRHSAFTSSEVFRILKRGGYFLTQQVGGGNSSDLTKRFDVDSLYRDWDAETAKTDLEKVGFKILRTENWEGKSKFSDVGALVYYLKVIPWAVPGFSLDSHLEYLEKLQEEVDKGKELVFTKTRFLILAQK